MTLTEMIYHFLYKDGDDKEEEKYDVVDSGEEDSNCSDIYVVRL